MMKKVKIKFNPEQHRYTDDEGNVYMSVTTVLKDYEEEYDNEFWAMYRALDQVGYKLRPNPEKRIIWVQNGNIAGQWFTLAELYAGIFKTYKTPSQIKEEWVAGAKKSTDRGTAKHNMLEDAINSWYAAKGTGYVDSGENFAIKIVSLAELKVSPMAMFEPEVYEMFVRLIEGGFTIYAEQRIYSYDHKVSGTIDVLAIKGKEFWIIDWKTNKDELKFESGWYPKVWDGGRQAKVKTGEYRLDDKRLKAPLNHLQKCKGVTYTLQLSLYAYLVELWGFTCKGLVLVQIRPMLDKYDNEMLDVNGHVKFYPAKFYTLPYLKDDVHKIMVSKLPVNHVTKTA